MNIPYDFRFYWDGNGLMTPQPVTPEGVIVNEDGISFSKPREQNVSGNGIMYLSEYMTILAKKNIIAPYERLYYEAAVEACIRDNILNRYPISSRMFAQEGPDDYYAVANACRELNLPKIPRELLWGFLIHLGFMNNENPGTWTFKSFLLRQPPLLTALINAAFPSYYNPLHMIVRLLALPLYVISAVAILFSCYNTFVLDTDPRRLGWHLQNNLKKNSMLCRFAALVWTRRLNNDYYNGMRSVAGMYYSPQHDNPYALHWVD